MTVRAKFTVNRIERSLSTTYALGENGKPNYSKPIPVEVQTIKMSPVMSGSDENKAFYAATPSGTLELATINVEAAQYFELNKDYYLDFTRADDD